MIGTVLLVFVLTCVVLSKVSPEASAIGVCLPVAVGSAGSSSGVLNPAITLVLMLGNLTTDRR